MKNLKQIGATALTLTASLALTPQIAEAKKSSAPTTATRPNVILINIDDLGWGDPSCYGGKLFETPSMDRLAAEGIRCTDGYVSAPVSGVSRIGLLTGSYSQRYGMQWNHDAWSFPGQDADEANILPESQRQIQSAFKDAGYATAMAGKIGIPNPQPFDNLYSYSQSGVDSFPDEEGHYAGVDEFPGGKKVAKRNYILWGPEREGDEHLIDRCGRQCVEFMDEHKDEPFFFYLAFNAPHTPLHGKLSDLPRVEHIQSPVGKAYASMVLTVDDNIGRILDYLEDEGLRENTIVVLLSDNGTANPTHVDIPLWWPEGLPYHILGQRGGHNGYKGTMWEAGIRIPYIISWPGTLAQGEVYENFVSTLDIYPTLCAATDVRIPDNTKLDGVNLMPYLKGGYDENPHKHLFWYANRMGAVRMDNWKMLIEDDTHYLFDLESDEGETKNVMNENPAVMKEMLDAYFAFRNEMPAYLNPYRRPIDIPMPECKDIPIREAW